ELLAALPGEEDLAGVGVSSQRVDGIVLQQKQRLDSRLPALTLRVGLELQGPSVFDPAEEAERDGRRFHRRESACTPRTPSTSARRNIAEPASAPRTRGGYRRANSGIHSSGATARSAWDQTEATPSATPASTAKLDDGRRTDTARKRPEASRRPVARITR